ncbi:LVIVD repeat-containing protein [Janibacter sp. GS2]|uniref:LVIVD repeat-containing protein n=1 Tax=Janibacter sp. GS2 TaxID=3442646 RepID=UPI003EBC04AC
MRRPTLAVVAATALVVSGLGTATATAKGPDDRVGVSGTDLRTDEIGRSKNVRHLANLAPSGVLAEGLGTDLAFQDDKAFVGNYDGFSVIDVRNPRKPRTIVQVSCPGSQNDVSVSGDLLYLSTDSSRSDDSCASSSQSATQKDSWEGIKIFDISDVQNPKYLKSVETACGSHTNTLIPGKGARAGTDYLYVSSYSPREEYPDCQTPHDLVSIVKIDKETPTASKVIATPNLFPDGGNPGGEGPTPIASRSATTGCHDITALPHKNLAAGACMGDGIIMDIEDPEQPRVIERVQDNENYAFWHSATFNADASKVVFTDELGGGGAATCNAEIGPERGANAIYDLSKRGRLTHRSYYKIPRHQTSTENCVAHNGSIIPVAGRDLMVQSWYQGGVSVWDFTDSENPRELGYFERGPLPESEGIGGTWSTYYYNGHLYSSDIARGFDVLQFKDKATKKADRVIMDELNVQSQPRYRVR